MSEQEFVAPRDPGLGDLIGNELGSRSRRVEQGEASMQALERQAKQIEQDIDELYSKIDTDSMALLQNVRAATEQVSEAARLGEFTFDQAIDLAEWLAAQLGDDDFAERTLPITELAADITPGSYILSARGPYLSRVLESAPEKPTLAPVILMQESKIVTLLKAHVEKAGNDADDIEIIEPGALEPTIGDADVIQNAMRGRLQKSSPSAFVLREYGDNFKFVGNEVEAISLYARANWKARDMLDNEVTTGRDSDLSARLVSFLLQHDGELHQVYDKYALHAAQGENPSEREPDMRFLAAFTEATAQAGLTVGKNPDMHRVITELKFHQRGATLLEQQES